MSLAGPAGARLPHALVMMLLIIVAAVALTWIVPSGRYDRTPAGLVIPGSYRRLPKEYRLGLQHPAAPAPDRAYPASPLAVVTSIPAGMVGAASLVFMIMFIGGLDATAAAQGFLQGVRTMVLAAFLVGLARSVELVLQDGQVLDSVIAFLSRAPEGRPRILAAQMMLFIEMAIDVLIPSTSGKAAVTMPILGPIGQLAGVSGQVIVQAFIFGNGLTNAVTPTSGMLLAYLAAGKVGYGEWLRFVLPLFLLLTVLSLAALAVAVVIGL